MPRSKSPSVPSYRLHKPSGQTAVRLSKPDYYLGPHDTEQSRAAAYAHATRSAGHLARVDS